MLSGGLGRSDGNLWSRSPGSTHSRRRRHGTGHARRPSRTGRSRNHRSPDPRRPGLRDDGTRRSTDTRRHRTRGGGGDRLRSGLNRDGLRTGLRRYVRSWGSHSRRHRTGHSRRHVGGHPWTGGIGHPWHSHGHLRRHSSWIRNSGHSHRSHSRHHGLRGHRLRHHGVPARHSHGRHLRLHGHGTALGGRWLLWLSGRLLSGGSLRSGGRSYFLRFAESTLGLDHIRVVFRHLGFHLFLFFVDQLFDGFLEGVHRPEFGDDFRHRAMPLLRLLHQHFENQSVHFRGHISVN